MRRVLVFTRTKHGANRVAEHLAKNGVGAEAIIDFVGEKGAVGDGVAMLRNGGSFFVIGYGENIDIPTIDVISREISFIGNLVGTYADLQELMTLTAEGQVTLHTTTYPLDAINDAMADLDGGLAGKGYRKAESGGDIGLVLTVGRESKQEIATWQKTGLPASFNHYSEGQLSIDAVDPKNRQAVWHGEAKQVVTPAHPDLAKISAAVQKLVAQFPATTPTAPAEP